MAVFQSIVTLAMTRMKGAAPRKDSMGFSVSLERLLGGVLVICLMNVVAGALQHYSAVV